MTEQGIVIKKEKEEDYFGNAYETPKQCSDCLDVRVENIKVEEELFLEDIYINNKESEAYETEIQSSYPLSVKVEGGEFSEDVYLNNNKENYTHSTNQCEDSLNELLSTHQSSEQTKNCEISKNYQCVYCHYSSSNRILFKKHIKKEVYNRCIGIKLLIDRNCVTRTKGRIGKFACKDCFFRSKFSGSLKRHIDIQHKENKPFLCAMCSFITNTKQNLRYHMKWKHFGKKRYSCPHCDFRAYTKSHAQQHIMLVHSGNPKPFSCPLCEYRTAQSHHLRRHVLSRHSDEKPFACHLCDYATKRDSVLQCHIVSKHLKDKRLSCIYPGCNYKTARKDYLKTHFVARHQKEKRLNCPYCSYKSSFPQCIKKHVLKTHSTPEVKKYENPAESRK